MKEVKTKAIKNLEAKMEGFDEETIRYKVLENAKEFKTSWIDLGQVLFTVWKDKLYKEWGFQEFDSYATKEIGIRKQTALKLLQSYSFLEKEEPFYLKKEYKEEKAAGNIPTLEAVDVLRKAKAKENKAIEAKDYQKIKKYVLEEGKDAGEVKKDLTALIKEREEIDPEEAWEKKRVSLLKRLLGTMRAAQTEIKTLKLLPEKDIKDLGAIIVKIEEQLDSY